MVAFIFTTELRLFGREGKSGAPDDVPIVLVPAAPVVVGVVDESTAVDEDGEDPVAEVDVKGAIVKQGMIG